MILLGIGIILSRSALESTGCQKDKNYECVQPDAQKAKDMANWGVSFNLVGVALLIISHFVIQK